MISAEYVLTLQLADMTERQCNEEFIWREGFIPDYLNDLNAMHGAEESLKDHREYERLLKWVCDHDWEHATVPMKRNPIYSTAGQRAEAFLRALGKWTSGLSQLSQAKIPCKV